MDRNRSGNQISIEFHFDGLRSRTSILEEISRIESLWRSGCLGGAEMPEDARPHLSLQSDELIHYLTLPMALNYQRNSYSLWKAATKAFQDPETSFVYNPLEASSSSERDLRDALVKHKVALQPNKHVSTWRRLCETFFLHFEGRTVRMLEDCKFSVPEILDYMNTHKKKFPYLSGAKIGNYWLYVLHQYSGFRIRNLSELSVAPDTHVIQASRRLGLIDSTTALSDADLRIEVAKRWSELLAGTGKAPIEIHTPLWLWSRAGFP